MASSDVNNENRAEAIAALRDDIEALKALVLEHRAEVATRNTEIEHLAPAYRDGH